MWRSYEFEEDDYPPVFEVELKVDDQYYELTIHAVTGSVLEVEHDDGDDNDD